MKVPALRRGNPQPHIRQMRHRKSLNESPRPKAGKFALPITAVSSFLTASMKVPALRRGNQADLRRTSVNGRASMKVPALRRGNSHPKLTRNYAAETGALREPRGRPTQKVYPSSHLSI